MYLGCVFSQVSLQMDSYNDGSFYHICGGTIIDPFNVMTAAHCILRFVLSSPYYHQHASIFLYLQTYYIAYFISILLSAWMLAHTVWWRVSITCTSMMAASSSSAWKELSSILAGMVNSEMGRVTANLRSIFRKCKIFRDTVTDLLWPIFVF